MDKFRSKMLVRMIGGLALGYAALNCVFKAGQQCGKLSMAEDMDRKLDDETKESIREQLE